MFFRRRPNAPPAPQLTGSSDRSTFTVYTFHERVKELGEQSELIELWTDSWRQNGWDPVVLGDEHARSHPRYRQYLNAVRKHPTANPKDYELACFKRWLAMVQVGGGWMVDYDVINYGFGPTPPTSRLTLHTGDWCPCVTSGSRSAYEAAVDAFEAYTGEYETYPGRPHLSDQDILKHRRDLFDSQRMCVNYSVEGWENSILVHYPNGLMAQLQPRARHIPELRRMGDTSVTQPRRT